MIRSSNSAPSLSQHLSVARGSSVKAVETNTQVWDGAFSIPVRHQLALFLTTQRFLFLSLGAIYDLGCAGRRSRRHSQGHG